MEVDNSDINNLLNQLLSMIKNQSRANPEAKVITPELADLQDAVNYLENCLYEVNQYINHLSRGELSVEPLSRHNYLAGNLKQLHSDLKHLTWQTNQVAEGDYKQKIDFLGEFSVSFNKMVFLLEEREHIMTDRAEALSLSRQLLLSVVDSINDWLIVLDSETGEQLFANLAIKKEQQSGMCMKKNCRLFNDLIKAHNLAKEQLQHKVEMFAFECSCSDIKRFFNIKGYPIAWNDRQACAFLITDVTEIQVQEKKLETLVYKDELTGAFNRRYGMDIIAKMLVAKEDFLLCFIDLDKLKYVNDTFGHGAGDEYISGITQCIQNSLRASDMLCRYGGDEFVLVLKKCSLEIGQEKLEEIRKTVIETSTNFPRSISYGLTYVTADNTFDMETLLQTADQYMYDYKVSHRGELEKIHAEFVKKSSSGD